MIRARSSDGIEGRLDRRVVNSATSTVISGDAGAMESLLQSLEAREIFCRRIRVNVASHSGHMDAVRAELEAVLRACATSASARSRSIPPFTTSGEVEDGSRLDAARRGSQPAPSPSCSTPPSIASRRRTFPTRLSR